MNQIKPEMKIIIMSEIEKLANILKSPDLFMKISLLRKRWLELYRAGIDLRECQDDLVNRRLASDAEWRAKEAVIDAVREFFYEEMGGGKA